MPRPLIAARWSTFVMYLVNGFGFGAWTTAIAPLKAELGLSSAQLSLALLSTTIGGIAALQPASHLIQKLGGTGRATYVMSFAWVLALAVLVLPPNLPLLMVTCAFFGATICLMDVAMNAHASRVEIEWGAAIMSSFHAGFSLGGLLGTGFGALMLMLHVPTHLLTVPASLVVAALSLVAVPYLGPGDTTKHESGPIFRLPEKSIALLAVILSLCFLSEGAMADWSGIYLTSLGETPARAAAGYAAFSATMVMGRLVGDLIVRRLGRTLVISAGAAFAAVGLVLATAFPVFWVIVGGFALVGAGLSNVVPCVFSAAAARASSPAAGIAEVSSAGAGGFLSGPPLIGAVAARHGMQAGIGVIAVAATLAALAATRLKGEAKA
ncbi:MFS family permease [Rhizomicrobium palustre]|uniref:MFS family permease n=1 Tax=Rhizomicrobium palustre TaxID=189966 RepID=A0A846MUE3_9PROT|nr:MFS transporter [Rhizomicrobium palustre]NIK86966.1 MFS family permease [Rhizomicrobium palustre]